MLTNCRDRVGTARIEFSVFLSRVVTLLVPLCLSIGPFYDSFGCRPPAPPVKRSSLSYACRLRARIGIERYGSASLSVLTGKYLSWHTPPPSTTYAAAVASVFVSSTRPSRSPTLSSSSRFETRFRATNLRTLRSERRAENSLVMQWWRSASRTLRPQPSYTGRQLCRAYFRTCISRDLHILKRKELK